MNPQDAVDLAREAVVMATLVAAPVLIAGVVVGLVIGLLQALTQIQEQTVAFVPKLIAMAIALGISLPWVMTRLIEYSRPAYYIRQHTSFLKYAQALTYTILQNDVDQLFRLIDPHLLLHITSK